jgi:hypothetical protein
MLTFELWIFYKGLVFLLIAKVKTLGYDVAKMFSE